MSIAELRQAIARSGRARSRRWLAQTTAIECVHQRSTPDWGATQPRRQPFCPCSPGTPQGYGSGSESDEDDESMKIAVCGLGYVGMTAAACLTKQGHDVIGVDVSDE